MATFSDTSGMPSNRFQFVVTIPRGTAVPPGLVIAQDLDPTKQSRYLWCPASRMQLSDYVAALRQVPYGPPQPNLAAAADPFSISGLDSFSRDADHSLRSYSDFLFG